MHCHERLNLKASEGGSNIVAVDCGGNGVEKVVLFENPGVGPQY